MSDNFLSTIVLIGMIAVFLFPLIYLMTYDFEDQKSKFVPCYDGKNNIIDGVNCIEESESPYMLFVLYIFLPLFLMLYLLAKHTEELFE